MASVCHYIAECGVAALCQSVTYGNKNITDFLLGKGIDVDGLDHKGDTPLCLAAGEGFGDICQFLLRCSTKMSLHSEGTSFTRKNVSAISLISFYFQAMVDIIEITCLKS